MDTENHHPKALSFLFLTEMWERFGFYVVQGLLVLYMTQYFGLTDSASYTILGIFTALAYISPLIGGYIANKILGFTVSIIWGGLFLVLGYALLALPYTNLVLYPALATIIVGNGLFKPNISSLLGTQYEHHDTRRDAGFTIFYIGINLGAFLAGISSGYIKDYFGWRISYALASIGLIIGLITFGFGLKYIKNQLSCARSFNFFLLFFYTLLAIITVNFLLKVNSLANWLLPAAGILLFVVLILVTLQQTTEYRKKMFVLNILFLSSIVFWALFFQIFYSVNLFVDRLVNKNLFGIPLSTTIFYASESIFIILLGPLFAFAWHALGKHNKNPSPVIKFMIGIFFAGLAFLVLGISTMFRDTLGLIHPAWVFFAYLLITMGELFLSPIGLSAVTALAPGSFIGVMMGVWFVAIGFGGIFAGWLAKLSSIAGVQTTVAKLAIYQHAFFEYAYLAFFIAICLFFLKLSMKRILRDKS